MALSDAILTVILLLLIIGLPILLNSKMIQTKVFYTLILLWLIVAPGYASLTDLNYAFNQSRELYLGAQHALNKNQLGRFKRLQKKLVNYPLYPYLTFEYLQSRIHKVPHDEIRSFIKEYSDTPLSYQLQKAWLHSLGSHGDWDTFLQEYKDQNSPKLRCYYLHARINTGKTEGIDDLIEKMWLVGRSQPKACDPVFSYWEKQGQLSDARIWDRAHLALQNRKFSLARFLAKKLDKSQQKWVSRWFDMHKRPSLMIGRSMFKKDIPIVREIMRYGIKRIARYDLDAAYTEWKLIKNKYRFSEQDIEETEKELAIRAATSHHPKAVEWLSTLKNRNISEATWLIRSSLLGQDWKTALSSIMLLPDDKLNSDQWQYWRARSLEGVGQSSQDLSLTRLSEQIFNRLAGNRSYYGFLAADKTGQSYNITASPVEYEESELQSIRAIPAMIRAYELFHLSMSAQGRREWRFALKKLDERQRQLAAVVANQWNWHDRAILTLAQTKHSTDLDLRFPVIYQNEVMSSAKQHKIDPAWVYGVVRQESAFAPDAQSRVGALGLMQLMPGTARNTAKLIKMPIKNKKEILNIDKNIHLGSAYLRRMLDRHNGHHVLATAAYNAGPHRIKKWLPNKDLPSDLWVESIPFHETRGYVRSVMAYTTIFDKRLDNTVKPMSTRMPVVSPLTF